MIKNFIPELRQRGLLQDIIQGTEEQLAKEMTSCYIGFDPTSDSLHIGSLLPIILLMHMQKAGHKPYVLVGGATGMIGDPSGKSAERNLLDGDILQKNVEGLQKQLSKFLNFDQQLENKAEMVNNFDWFKEMSFLNFIREIGKHITVNYMMAKDSVKNRLEGGTGMSFTEFTYQLIQGFDFYYLNTEKKVQLQAGGADQWGNIVTGTELIRRKGGYEAFAFTCPLLKKADGGKFGKSESGNIWLDPQKTSPYAFYQYWLNVADEDAKNLIKIFTFLPLKEIEVLIIEHETAPHLRSLQKKLAEEITVMVHSQQDFEAALETTNFLFGKNTNEELQALPKEAFIKLMTGVPFVSYDINALKNGVDFIQFLSDTQIFPSKGEAKKMVQGGGVSINKIKINKDFAIVDESMLLKDKFMLINKGKKEIHFVSFE